MYKSILISTLMLISALSFAGTVTVNGHSCGSLITLTTTPAGDLTIKADGTCGTVAPPVEPPPVVTPPSSCPAGVTCLKRTWPLKQEIISLRAGQTVAIAVPAESAGTARYVQTMITAGNSAARRLAISTTAGDVNPANTRCATRGWESVSMNYTAGDSGGARGCFVPAGVPIFINLAPTNCPEGQRCDVYIKGQ